MQRVVAIAVAVAGLHFSADALTQGQLNIVCSVRAPWCEGVAN